ncbi:MAG: precorrin-2 dehydrogenase/sirohydrochlorin ferrochelatase family protein [Nitritalea sp.]
MNPLYPIFVKASEVPILLVGAGFVGTEKIGFLLKSSPRAKVTVVAPFIREEFRETIAAYPEAQLHIEERHFRESDLSGHVIVIAATDDVALNQHIAALTRAAEKLVNVADTPPLCDFYLGGIVTKGHVKVAISTNGKSPTTAKRLRQLLEEILPDELDELVLHLDQYRKQLKGDFEAKVQALNEHTKSLIK